MFVSGHDRDVLVVVATAAATVGLLAALVLGDRIARSSRAVADLASRIGDGRWSGGSVVEPVAGEFVGLSADLTRMAERLQAASEREKRLEASRRELVAWVSHDLRTPLAAIRAMVEAIEDGVVADPAVIERYHRDIGSEVQRLTALVDDLFMLSRIDSGALDRVREPVPIADLVSDAVAAVGPLAAQREVTVRGQRGHDDPIVWGSASDLARILHNLLDNALCHTPPSGRVSVRVGSGPAGRGDAVVIEVDDSGPGVPAADREAIFEVGRTGDSARSRGSGSGLGLAIARGLVEAHGGTISVGSSPELGGARLSVVLPVEGAAAEPVR
jgi:signal transduction histidine kinase